MEGGDAHTRDGEIDVDVGASLWRAGPLPHPHGIAVLFYKVDQHPCPSWAARGKDRISRSPAGGFPGDPRGILRFSRLGKKRLIVRWIVHNSRKISIVNPFHKLLWARPLPKGTQCFPLLRSFFFRPWVRGPALIEGKRLETRGRQMGLANQPPSHGVLLRSARCKGSRTELTPVQHSTWGTPATQSPGLARQNGGLVAANLARGSALCGEAQ